MTARNEGDLDGGKMPLLDHLIELRRRLMYSVLSFFVFFGPAWYFSNDIYNFLAQPLARILMEQTGGHFIYTDLTEAFFVDLRIAFWTSICLSFPVIASQVWMFVAPGLYKNERGAFLPYLFATPILFIIGGCLAYFVIFPFAFRFFASFQEAAGHGMVPITLEPKISEYLTLVMRLIFAFGFAFQMPVLLTLMARVGIVTSAGLKRVRRYAIVGIFVLAAILTPPDIFSQCSLAVPLLALYEISIWSCRIVERNRERRRAAEEAEETTPPPGDAP
ncbi:MAG: twin-arginine translocase subunit TatC [Stellaceae bacterium]